MSTFGRYREYIGEYHDSCGGNRADQNTSSALLESPVRTAMHGKSRISSVISVELNCLQYLL